ncbi:phosphoribosylanthranilate isomerase [Acetobacter vaccinii]|uniref:N-(5'-phosphoribosyl)anthranilate isomerase n=1 Tax=Acetobacter vaccinii TaxID=2592655 RepID=A0A5C1YR18_9PROT|nr:phosphoribosylanthranilate isomerase [Acetobacter vaccinii]QEO17639.1 phosphoribosylanthranilate isomerase [Acetobacter vaccinii]
MAHTGAQSVGVKICGLTEAVGFDACVEHGADWVGFVFFQRSPRFVTPEQARQLSARTIGGPARVGLFVRPDAAVIADVLKHVRLDVLQLYTSVDEAEWFSKHFDLPVWLSLPVSRRAELPATRVADRVLIEPKPPADATRPGGNGQQMDWSMMADWQPAFPWMLAGGLTPDNVAAAIARTGAPAVDVSSGVEEAPGIKSPAAIARFIRNAQAAITV